MCLFFDCNDARRPRRSLAQFEGLVFVRLATGVCVFQVTGRESFKADRPSRPVKIAESDADVSEPADSKAQELRVCLPSL